MRPLRSRPLPRALALLLAHLVALAGASSAGAQACGETTLRPLTDDSIGLPYPADVTARVLVLRCGQPVAGQTVRWFNDYETTAVVTGLPPSSVSGPDGVASASFRITTLGEADIIASADLGAPNGELSFHWFVFRTFDAGSRPVSLERGGPSNATVSIGHSIFLFARVLDEHGNPRPGIAVEWLASLEPSAGGPQQVLTPSSNLPSDAWGESIATFVAPRPGVLRARATLAVTGSTVDFARTVEGFTEIPFDTGGDRSVAEAIERLCGRTPETAELGDFCRHMLIGAERVAEYRSVLVRSLTARQLNAPALAAREIVAADGRLLRDRLAAVRHGSLAGAGPRIELELGNVRVGTEQLAAAASGVRPGGQMESQVDRALGLQTPVASGPTTSAGGGAEDWSLFVHGRAMSAERARSVEETGFGLDNVGMTLGVDRRLGDRGLAGAAFSWDDSTADPRGDAGELGIEGFSGAIYGQARGESAFATLVASYGRWRFDQMRRITPPRPVSSLPVEGRASFGGDHLALALEVGASVAGRAGSWTISGRAEGARVGLESYREAGAVTVGSFGGPGNGSADLGLEIGEREINSLVGELILEWRRSFAVAGGAVAPRLAVSSAHELESSADPIRARFLVDADSQAAFVVPTDELDRSWIHADAGLRWGGRWGEAEIGVARDFGREELERTSWSFRWTRGW